MSPEGKELGGNSENSPSREHPSLLGSVCTTWIRWVWETKGKLSQGRALVGVWGPNSQLQPRPFTKSSAPQSLPRCFSGPGPGLAPKGKVNKGPSPMAPQVGTGPAGHHYGEEAGNQGIP